MAADGTVLRFDSVLRIQPARDELEQYLFGLRAPREHMMGLFSCLLRNEIANFGVARAEPSTATTSNDLTQVEHEEAQSSYALILRNRQTLNARIEAFCRDEIATRYGLRFHGVDLTDILPPDELADALNAMINAEKEAEELLSRTEAECGQQVLAASRGVAIAKARATAAETEILGLAGYLEELRATGVLDRYVARRRTEVFAEARSTFVKGALT
jgi:regulator of protease activity HflC (stomatin/prohibitin superfamily)